MAKKQQTPPNSSNPAARPAAPKQAAPATATSNVKPIKENSFLSITQLCIGLAILAIALYINTLKNGFVLDDVMVLKENKMVLKGFAGIGELMQTPHMRGYLIIPNDMYRPLSLVMFAIEYEIFGLSPMMGHLFNVLWFAGCVVVLFLFLDKFFAGKKTIVALIAAMIFAVHPIHTEVVANIKSRDELMCFFFGFLSLNVFMNYMRNGKITQLLMGSFILFLSYLSKETVLSFVALVPIIFFFYRNENTQRAINMSVGTVVVTLIFIGIRWSVLKEYNANQPTPVEFIDNALAGAPSVAAKFCTGVVVMGKYLKLMFLPYPLLCNYSFNAIPFADFTSIAFWLSFAAYGGLGYVLVTRFMKSKNDPWVFSILFYLGTIFLFSNLPFLMGAELAERFTFFASLGICLAGALAVEKWILKSENYDLSLIKSSKVLMILAPLVLVFGGMTFARNQDWIDDYTLYKTDVEKSPNDCRLHHFVATSIAENRYPNEKDSLKKKEYDRECIGHLHQSLAIYPKYSQAFVELGRVYDRNRVFDSAEYYDRKALEEDPGNSTATNNLGNVYLANGKYVQAIEYFKKSLALDNNFKYAYYNLGLSYKQLQRYDSAIYYYHRMLGFEPNYLNAIQEIGTCFYQLQRFDSAAVYFKKVLALNPNDPNAVNNMGAVHLNAKQYAQAIEYFKKTIELAPTYVNAYSNLGRCYFLSGQYQAAIDIINKELTIDKSPRDIPYIAMSYQKLGNMAKAKEYEAIAKQFYSDFKLP